MIYKGFEITNSQKKAIDALKNTFGVFSNISVIDYSVKSEIQVCIVDDDNNKFNGSADCYFINGYGKVEEIK